DSPERDQAAHRPRSRRRRRNRVDRLLPDAGESLSPSDDQFGARGLLLRSGLHSGDRPPGGCGRHAVGFFWLRRLQRRLRAATLRELRIAGTPRVDLLRSYSGHCVAVLRPRLFYPRPKPPFEAELDLCVLVLSHLLLAELLDRAFQFDRPAPCGAAGPPGLLR